MNVREETFEPARTRVSYKYLSHLSAWWILPTVEVPGRVEVVDLLGFDSLPGKCLLRQNEQNEIGSLLQLRTTPSIRSRCVAGTILQIK